MTIPRMLASLVGGDRDLEVDARTVGDALDGVVRHHPELGVHLFDETGALRRHILCFHNDNRVRNRAQPIEDGDRITVLQAVSGG